MDFFKSPKEASTKGGMKNKSQTTKEAQLQSPILI